VRSTRPAGRSSTSSSTRSTLQLLPQYPRRGDPRDRPCRNATHRSAGRYLCFPYNTSRPLHPHCHSSSCAGATPQVLRRKLFAVGYPCLPQRWHTPFLPCDTSCPQLRDCHSEQCRRRCGGSRSHEWAMMVPNSPTGSGVAMRRFHPCTTHVAPWFALNTCIQARAWQQLPPLHFGRSE